MCISIKKDKKEFLSEFEQKKCQRQSKILENSKAYVFKKICQ